MTRRKGERTAGTNERACPCKVELAMPDGGLGKTLDLIHKFHRDRGIALRPGHYQRRDDRDHVRWCFTNAEDAHAFQKKFGGAVIR